MRKPNIDISCFKNSKNRCMYAVWFGLGLTLASFCPAGLTLFLAGVILVALGISILKV